MRIVAPFGFYGCGNIGDEATLQGFARLIALTGKRLHVSVGSHDPSHTRRVEPRFRYFPADRRNWKKWLAKRISSAVVVAGGTPIMDCLGKWPLCEVTPLMEAAQHRRQPIGFIGIGTERLARKESRQIVAERLGPCVRVWTVRSWRDQARLVEYGIPADRIAIAADMAWLLDPVSPEWGQRRLLDWGLGDDRRLLGVNFVGEKGLLEREPQLFEKLAQFLDSLIQENRVFVLFLSNEVRDDETFDTAAAQKTRTLMKHAAKTFIAPNEYLSPQQMLSLVGNCYATMSMRYHFCLFSALQGVPFLALQRSDKVVDLCNDLNWPYGKELRGFSTTELVEAYREMEIQALPLVEDLRTNVEALRQRAIDNLVALDALAESGLERAQYPRAQGTRSIDNDPKLSAPSDAPW
jgi:polysaccharide pyruvyl transferase WcaK-like protein